MSANSIFVMPPGCQFSLPSMNAHDWFTVYYPSEFLFPASVRTIESDRVGRVVSPGDELATRLASSIRKFVRAAEIEPTVLSEQASIEAFQESLLSTARHILGAAQTPEEQHCPVVCRQELIASVVEFLGDCPRVMPTVKELAAKLGFWDFGRFAGTYRKLFNELPSQTNGSSKPVSLK